MLHYNPRHVSSINMPVFRRTNCIITASAIVALCKRLHSMPDESGLGFCVNLDTLYLLRAESRLIKFVSAVCGRLWHLSALPLYHILFPKAEDKPCNSSIECGRQSKRLKKYTEAAAVINPFSNSVLIIIHGGRNRNLLWRNCRR
jgi:hypothetical protein